MTKLNALILCGGNSSRLGIPKFKIEKEGIPLYKYWIQLLQEFCPVIYISCKESQVSEIDHPLYICDTQDNRGPLEGIYRAFETDPKANWLVIACDLVYANKSDLLSLLQHQDDAMDAIAFNNPETGEAFPLMTIYNRGIYSALHTEYKSNSKSPKRLLMNSNVQLIVPEDPIILMGINTREEYEDWKKSRK